MTQLTIRAGSWDELQDDAKLIRVQVFILEQQIAVEDEWDEQDAISQHFVIYDHTQPVATARLLQNNSVGRVAVLKSHRGLGIGKVLMLYIIEQAKQQQRADLKLSSQVHAMPFYASLGFKAEGDEYLDCGIPHQDMALKLKS